MYKTKTMRKIKEGLTRLGSDKSLSQRKVMQTAPANGRWNKGKLPKGAIKK